MFRRWGWLFVGLFGLALAGATWTNLTLIGQARDVLDAGILRSSGAGDPLRLHLALIIPETRDPFFDGLTTGVKEAAGRIGAAVQVFRYRETSPDDAEAQFQLGLSARLDGIILYSATYAAVERRRADAAAANVVFVGVGNQVPPGRPGGFVGSNRLLQGLEAGNQLAQKLGGRARIGLILSAEAQGAGETDPVALGVRAALGTYPGAVVLRTLEARPGLLSGEEAAQQLLRAEPEVNVLVAASGPVTEGAAQVLVDQGRVGRVLLVGTDDSAVIGRLVDKGVILASVVRDSRRMGSEAVAAFAAAKQGHPALTSVEVGYTVRRAGGATR